MPKQKLIIISGSPCVGKTTVATSLYQTYENSACCDGNWMWCVNPFSIYDPRIRTGDKNMSFVLSTYLHAKFDYIFFSSVVVMYESIRETILKDITAKDYTTIGFTLTCSKETLIRRHKKRGDKNEISFEWLMLDPYPNDFIINTDNKTVSQIIDEIRNIIDKFDAANCIELYTNDLLLRTVDFDDIDEVARMWEFQDGPVSTAEAKDAIEYMQKNHDQNQPGYIHHLCFAIFKKGENRIIGWCGLDGTCTPGQTVIFYALDEICRNKGYATQCASRLLSYAFEDVGLERIDGGCMKDNIASYRVQEKAGMIQYAYEENGDPLFFIDKTMYHKF